MTQDGGATLVEQRPRPRALLMGLVEDKDQGIFDLFPFSQSIPESAEVYEPDWDVFVSRSLNVDGLTALHGVAFGAAMVRSVGLAVELTPARADVLRATKSFSLRFREKATVARDLAIPDDLDDELKALVKRDLLPAFEWQASRRPILVSTSLDRITSIPTQWLVKPFITASDGSILAGEVVRVDWRGKPLSVTWLLPYSMDNAVDWVKLAWRRWSQADPDRIPSPPTWTQAKEWFSGEERRLSAELDRLHEEKLKALARYDLELLASERALQEARDRADRGARGVLTEQGNALVMAVAQLLGDVGFEVDNMDERASPGDRLEDLRVRTPGGGWEAVVEVRGYKRGAQLHDLMRLERFARRYFEERQRFPDARWYIANSFLRLSPSERQAPLASNPLEVASFGETDGMVLDSVDLYRLWQATQTGELTQEAALESLTGARGRYRTPEHGSGLG